MKIIFKDVTLSFNSRTIIDGLNLTIGSGITALYGPSGIGKTSIVRMIMRLIKPDGGQITLPDKMIISAAFQEHRLFPFMTVIRNIMLPLNKSCRELAKNWMENFNIEHLVNERAASLSGGEKQRVSLARAMAYYESKRDSGENVLLILDEPFSGIDESNALSAAKHIKDCISSGNCILISHDYTFCRDFADRTIELDGPPLMVKERV
ncbi:MAG TPA: ATP-binding cassette domain-containing protein [Firmicutes bacterium]|nr:ATP-binding cassette domain-containing protein [Bacillota bacterium]